MHKLRNLSVAILIFFLLVIGYKHRDDWLGTLGQALPGLPGRTVVLTTVHPPLTALKNQLGPVSYAAAVQVAAPAVVNIYTRQMVRINSPLALDPFFQRFFGTPMGTQQKQGLGSGVLVSPDGYILTNNHVIAGADQIVVALADGRETQAQVVGADPDTDIAVLRVHLDHLPVAHLRLNPPLQVGDVVLAIGNPFGFSQSVTQGIVSALGRQGLGINVLEDFIQTDAAINPGNSGGALIDALGNLVGINSAIYSRSGGNMGIGFAIPVGLAKDVLAQIITHGRVVRGWLGVALAGSPQEGMLMNAGQNIPVYISEVLPGGPADLAGLRPGDQIVAVNHQKLESAAGALQMIVQLKPESQVQLEIRRGAQEAQIAVRVAERPSIAVSTGQP